MTTTQNKEALSLGLMRVILKDRFDIQGAAIAAEDAAKHLGVSPRTLRLLMNQLMGAVENAGEMNGQLAHSWLVYYVAQAPIHLKEIKMAIPQIAKEVGATTKEVTSLYCEILIAAVLDTFSVVD